MNEMHFEDRESLTAIDAIAGGLGEEWFVEQTHSDEAIAAKTIQRLRKDYGPIAARWLLEFAAAHGKAVEKFGAGRWLTTQRGIQQATDRHTAAYKAFRFPLGEPVVDFCCGIGGDAMALARRGPTLAVDLDPHVARMAAANLAQALSPAPDAVPDARNGMVVAFAAESLLPLPTGRWIHVDPDRRSGDRRTIDPALYQPPLATVEKAIENARGAAVKLAPATTIPPAWESRCTREWISFRGSVRQQVAWFGELRGDARPGTCQATRLLPDGAVSSFAVESENRAMRLGSTEAIGRYIVDFDPAVRAAGLSISLAETLGLQAIGGPAGFFTANRFDRWHPLAESYEIVWSGAGSLKVIEAAVRASGTRIDAIKVRGASIRPERIQKKIRQAEADEPKCGVTLLIGCLGKRIYAVIGKRIVCGVERRSSR